MIGQVAPGDKTNDRHASAANDKSADHIVSGVGQCGGKQ